MSCSKYSDNELQLMSYQELRRLSILLRLPANIKKKYMISMIQAHQKGDGCTKTAIANKIMEERKIKRISSKGKQTKPFILGTAGGTQQIPTDLSVSTKHEFETRFSYVAHYTSKDNTGNGISRIIKQEAEVSRRNRSILQQPRKPTRKLPGVGRTEIMLPRNHSLTTPVRVMPQYERGFAPPTQYEAMSGISTSDNHFQVANTYNYHFPGDYSNSMMTSSSHELYRNEPYWHTRDVYNNSFMPILSSLLAPNPATINTTSYAVQSTFKGPNSFQEVYEKYIKNSNIMESQAFESCVTNSSTVIVNNHFPDSNNNNYSISHGNYIVSKNEVDFEINSALDEINYQQYNRRDDTVIRHANGSQAYLEDVYLPRNSDSSVSSPFIHNVASNKDYSDCNSLCYRTEEENISQTSVPHGSYEPSSVTSDRNVGISDREPEPPLTPVSDYEENIENEKCWEGSEDGSKVSEDKVRMSKDNFTGTFMLTQSTGSFISVTSVTSDNSGDFSEETDNCEEVSRNHNKRKEICTVPNFSRCRYTLGHNKYPEAVSTSCANSTVLPSFLSAFCTNGQYNKAYSICRNSFTGTTETHLNPIMTSSYATQFSGHASSQPTHTNNPVGGSQIIPRHWLYSYPEPQVPYSMESGVYSTWDEYSDDVANKITAHSNGHDVQIVKCRKHGYHYVYSVGNPCE